MLVRALHALAVVRYCLPGLQLCNTSTRCKCWQGLQIAASMPMQAQSSLRQVKQRVSLAA